MSSSASSPLSKARLKGPVQVPTGGRIFPVHIARTRRDLEAARQLDNLVFGAARGVTAQEMQEVARCGYVLLLWGGDSGLIGQSRVVVAPTSQYPQLASDEAYCSGTAVHPQYRGYGFGRILARAQETCARHHQKERMSLLVRPENGRSIRMRLALGFHIVGYAPLAFAHREGERGGRLRMEKSLVLGMLPPPPWLLVRLLEAGDVLLVNDTDRLAHALAQAQPLAIPVQPGDDSPESVDDAAARALLEHLFRQPYMGIGLLRPEEHGLPFPPPGKNLLVFWPKERIKEVVRLLS
ncbi:MAG: GNAT family N-acetyltransferase [Dehalococcoidia bacterium]